MLHKKIHAHAKKHAQRAHAHVQEHGHKWLWFLSGVFAIILVYPYFSSAQETSGMTEDICINGDNSPSLYDCLCEIDGETSEEICPVESEPTEIIPLTGTITYSPTTSTTGTVTATLANFSTTGVTITNNSGNNTYVFNENESFTFEFQNDAGSTGSAVATVNWITTGSVQTGTNSEGNGTGGSNTGTVIPCTTSIHTPISGSILGATFPITRSSTGSCTNTQAIQIHLRDHNNQRIQIGTGTIGQTGIVFNTTGLATTGFYTITGIHTSGSARQQTSGGVVIATGVYTQDTPYTIYTGAYSGTYTDFATGYKIKIITETGSIIAEMNNTFTIDNQKPIISNLNMSFSNVVSGSVGRPSLATVSISSSETVSGATFIILGTHVIPTTESQSGNIYTFTVPLANVATTGALALTAHVFDLAGNTGTIYGTSNVIFNNRLPQISNFVFTGGSGSIALAWNTDLSAKFNMSYTKSGTANTVYHTGTQYGTAHTYTVQNTQNNSTYIFNLSVSDILGNTRSLSGDIAISSTGVVSIGFDQGNIPTISPEAETNLYLQILQNEVNKFKACRNALTLNAVNIPVGTKNIQLQVPVINKAQVKNAMNGFLLLFTNKVKTRTELSQAELTEVATVINNFLVILKLTDDNENACQQSMSNYYLGAFENMMSQMKFF